MAGPFYGEIRMFAFSRAPVGWLLCDGTTHNIADHDTLYMLIGNSYGGDGVQTFAVPDMRGRVPVGQGQGPNLSERLLGKAAGDEQVTLQVQHLPAHSHSLQVASEVADLALPKGAMLAAPSNSETMYISANKVSTLTPKITSAAGSTVFGDTKGHDNLMPTLTISYCICAHGLFPPRSN